MGIGIGTPGLVNITEGIMVNAVNPDWKDLPLARLMEERYRLPVLILNDSQAAAMGEYTYGHGRHAESNLIVINARHGIGAGVIIHGQLFHGDGGGAGEIGHVVVVPVGGLLCYCGNRGCLETVASAQAQELVSQPIQTQLPRSAREITLDVIEQAFTHGDSNVHHAVMETGRYLGMAISNLVGTLNIQLIVLTGDMTIFGSPWLDAIREVFTVTTLSRLVLETRIEIGQLGENNIILRASATLANNYSLLFKSQLVHS